MAGRSTRTKIRWAVGEARKKIQGALMSLQTAEENAEEKSPVLNEYMPSLVEGLEAMDKVLSEVFEKL